MSSILYKLHIGDQVFESENIEDLRRLRASKEQDGVIFMHVLSKMGSRKFQGMSINEMEEAALMEERGVGQRIIARKFGVGLDYLRKVINQVKKIKNETKR